MRDRWNIGGKSEMTENSDVRRRRVVSGEYQRVSRVRRTQVLDEETRGSQSCLLCSQRKLKVTPALAANKNPGERLPLSNTVITRKPSA